MPRLVRFCVLTALLARSLGAACLGSADPRPARDDDDAPLPDPLHGPARQPCRRSPSSGRATSRATSSAPTARSSASGATRRRSSDGDNLIDVYVTDLSAIGAAGLAFPETGSRADVGLHPHRRRRDRPAVGRDARALPPRPVRGLGVHGPLRARGERRVGRLPLPRLPARGRLRRDEPGAAARDGRPARHVAHLQRRRRAARRTTRRWATRAGTSSST